jgi:hypothetical protein
MALHGTSTMPLTYHVPIEVAADVPWVINGQLCDATGVPFDVTNAQLAWVLLNADSFVVPTSASITKNDPANGAIRIEVAKMDTALPPGRYTDALQIRGGTGRGIYWIGFIEVAGRAEPSLKP